MPIDIALAATAVGLMNSTLSLFKETKTLAQSSDDMELKSKIGDVFDKLVELKETVLELKQENDELRNQLSRRGTIARQGEFGYYFEEGDSDPLCPICYERDGRVIHLPSSARYSDGTKRICNVCKTVIYENHQSQQSATFALRQV